MKELDCNIQEKLECFPIITEKESPDVWYYWLRITSENELIEIENILKSPFDELNEYKINKLRKYNIRKRIGDLIIQQKTQHVFSYDEQQEVLKFTRENSLDELIEEKLSYFTLKEANYIKNKVKKLYF